MSQDLTTVAPAIQKKPAAFVTYHTVNRNIEGGRYRYDHGDLCVVKEKWLDEEGKLHKRLNMIENYPRPFWITKPRFRKFKDKREWAYFDEVDMFRSPHHNLSFAVQKDRKSVV